MSLRDRIFEGMSTALKQKTMTTCSRWASDVVVMENPEPDFDGPLSYKYYPWLPGMQDTEARMNIGQKAAQMGFTTACLNWSMFKIDRLKQSVLYLLPSKTPDATDFSSNRFDPMLDASPKLKNLFSDVKNVGSKRAGSAILYIRGANSRSGLKSVPAGNIVYDERDEMAEMMIELAKARTSAQTQKQTWMISTPRFPGRGINEDFLESTQEHFTFKCPGCSQHIELLHENLVITGEAHYDPNLKNSYYKCVLCDKQLTFPNETPKQYRDRKAAMLAGGLWTPFGASTAVDRGFYINQLYAPAILPFELAEIYLKAAINKAAEQEYHNSRMGDAHECEGARIADSDIDNCYYKDLPPVNTTLVTMGVDVGKWLHYEIAVWRIKKLGNDLANNAECVVLKIGKVPTDVGFRNLDELMRNYQVKMCVVDANPETASATAFAKRFSGHVRLCYYDKGRTPTAKLIDNKEESKVNVHRATWLDMSLGRFFNRTIHVPFPVDFEYRGHLKNIGRVFEEDKDGNPVSRYVNNGADHFAHARNYNEIAFPLAASISHNSDVRAFL